MSKTRSRLANPPASAARRGNVVSEPAPLFLPPLRPRKSLMIALGLILLIWMGILLAMYFRTVYPLRHENPRPAHAPADLPER